MNENLIKVEVGPDDFSMIPVSKLCGWKGEKKPELLAEAFSTIRNDEELSSRILLDGFNIKGEMRPSYGGQRMMLWEVSRKILGKDTPNYAQQIGDCTSFAEKNVLEYVQLFDIANTRKVEEFKYLFPPYFYGCGRVLIGNGRLWGDGSMGAWQAQGAIKYGAVNNDMEGCPQYAGSIARNWGRGSGPPKNFIEYGQKHLCESIALVKTWEDLLKSLMNGYPVSLCSNVGYDMNPRSDGFNHYSTNWAHAMALIGIDDGGGPGLDGKEVEAHGCVLNSWGSQAHGPIKDFRTGETWPAGTIRARKKDILTALRGEDSFAYSSLNGFEARELPIDFFDMIPSR